MCWVLERYGLKRVNGFWQSDDVKSAVFKLAVGKHFTKEKWLRLPNIRNSLFSGQWGPISL